MSRRILSMVVFFSLMVIGLPLLAEEIVKSVPKIVLNPTVLNVGDLEASGPVTYTVTINNLGESPLHISKIKYY